MKIAVVTEDGITISQHFGRAPYYLICSIENNKITVKEKRDKLGHAQFAGSEEHSHQADARGHGFNPDAQPRHANMAAAISDCQVLIARGMGAGAYESMKMAGIQPAITDIPVIDEAIQAYLEGNLIDHVEKLH